MAWSCSSTSSLNPSAGRVGGGEGMTKRVNLRMKRRAVQALGLDGMLSTTWHHLYGLSMHPIYWSAAHAMWGTRPIGSDRLVFTHHLRQVGWDIPVKDYRDTGFYHYQLPENNYSPR